MKKTFILIACMMMQIWAFAFSKGQGPKAFKQASPSMGFEENKGQITDQYGNAKQDIQYTLKVPGLDVFVGNGALHYQFYRTEQLKDINIPGMPKTAKGKSLPVPIRTTTYRMDVNLVGANISVIPTVIGAVGGINHYYTNAKQKDGAAVRTYQKVTYANIYPGIDWVLYVQDNGLKYDFVVHPGANTADIQLSYNGDNNISQQRDGSIQAVTPYGTITEQAPKSYQLEDHKVISSNFQLSGNKLTYAIKDAYQGTLVIDPGVVWATYYGGGNETIGGGCNNSVACDPSGYIYMAGITHSADNIATTGSYQDTLTTGSINNFIVKFDSAGNRLWATYYGGGAVNIALYGFFIASIGSIACDNSYHVYLDGFTSDTSGIATAGSFQDTLTPGANTGSLYGGDSISLDAYLVQFDSAGIRQWGTYYGGNGEDEALAVTCGKDGNGTDVAYIYGLTCSTNGIATSGAYQDTIGPCVNCTNNGDPVGGAFLAQFSTNGALQWSTYYGDGNQGEYGDGMVAAACDGQGNVNILGLFVPDNTVDNAAYGTLGTFEPVASANNTGYENYAVQFNNTGARNWGTFVGGGDANAISCDANNHIYIGGTVASSFGGTGISTPGSFLENLPFPQSSEGFLMQFNNISGQRNWGTYYYGNIFSVACDPVGVVYIAGTISAFNNTPPNTNACATPGSYQDSLIVDTVGGSGNNTNVFLCQFDSLGNRHWGTYFGGGNERLDNGTVAKSTLACDKNGNLYLTGLTTIDTHVATPGSYQDTLGTVDTTGTQQGFACNAFLVRFAPVDVAISGFAGSDTVCIDSPHISVTLQNKGHLAESAISVNAIYIYNNYATGISDTSIGSGVITTGALTAGGTTTVTINGLNLHLGLDTIQVYIQHVTDDSSFADDTLTIAVMVIACNAGIANVNGKQDISVYPNPAQQILNIQVPAGLQATGLSIINTVGAKVYTEKVDVQNTTKSLNVHGLADGYYILKVSTNQGYYNLPFEILN